MYEAAINIAKGAALMTDTKMSYKILGTAWPRHFNKSIAEAMYKNIEVVGLPQWSEEDQLLAKAVQKELGNKTTDGLAVELSPLGLPVENPRSGGSDDIGDVSWTIPTVTLRFPSNIPGLPGHHWANAITMATPIAHKGVTAGAQVEAMTLIDMLTKPQILEEAWAYFNEEQTKDTKYEPMIQSDTEAPTYLNTEIDKRYRPELKKFFYNEKKYASYLEQLGVSYPTLKKE
jgi:aminobenzoyl-glutamate utilization protein B